MYYSPKHHKVLPVPLYIDPKVGSMLVMMSDPHLARLKAEAPS